MKKIMLGINKQLLTGALLTVAFTAPQAYALSSSPLDLTVEGSSGSIESLTPLGGAIALFGTSTFSPSGTGVFPAFVQVQQPNANVTVERGVNGTGQAMDEGPSEQHNYPILLSDIPTLTVGGITYRSFLLDINESNNDNDTSDNPYISIDQIKIFLSNDSLPSSNFVEDPEDPGNGLLTGANLVYDMSSNDPNNWIEFYDRHHGSGEADMYMLVPDRLFDRNMTYLYLFSAFGYQGGIWQANDLGTNAGFEEWAAGPGAPVPEPATMLLFGTGLIGLAGMARRKRN